MEYLARLRYYDAESGARKEKSRSAPTISEAKRCVREMEEEFELGGQTAVESDLLTFADLVKHCKETRYCEAQFDSEGRKIVGVRGKSTVDSHIKERIVKLECKSGEKDNGAAIIKWRLVRNSRIENVGNYPIDKVIKANANTCSQIVLLRKCLTGSVVLSYTRKVARSPELRTARKNFQ